MKVMDIVVERIKNELCSGRYFTYEQLCTYTDASLPSVRKGLEQISKTNCLYVRSATRINERGPLRKEFGLVKAKGAKRV